MLYVKGAWKEKPFQYLVLSKNAWWDDFDREEYLNILVNFQGVARLTREHRYDLMINFRSGALH